MGLGIVIPAAVGELVEVHHGIFGVEAVTRGSPLFIHAVHDHAVGDAPPAGIPHRGGVLRAPQLDEHLGLALRLVALGDSHESAGVDELGLHDLAVLALQGVLLHQAGEDVSDLLIRGVEAVEAAAHGQGVHGLLRPAHHGLDVLERRRDGDLQGLEDVLALVVAIALLVVGELSLTECYELREHTSPLIRDRACELHGGLACGDLRQLIHRGPQFFTFDCH